MAKKIDYQKAKEWYDQGKSDGEIARELGCSTHTIFMWRKANRLPATHMPFTALDDTGKAGYELSHTYDPESLLNTPECINYFIKGKKHG